MPKVEKKHKELKEYRKPIVVNDWGYLGYFLKAVKSDSGTWSLRDQDQTEKIKPGEVFHVLWPDGHISLEKVRSKTHVETVVEQGGPMGGYEVKSEELFFELKTNGLTVDVPIQDLYVKRAG